MPRIDPFPLDVDIQFVPAVAGGQVVGNGQGEEPELRDEVGGRRGGIYRIPRNYH